jgi:hypothetical protein
VSLLLLRFRAPLHLKEKADELSGKAQVPEQQ